MERVTIRYGLLSGKDDNDIDLWPEGITEDCY